MRTGILLLTLMLLILGPQQLMADNKFVGAGKCKACHRKKKEGEQFKKWSSGPHAKAFKSLATPEAKKMATAVGVSGNPQQAKACLVCHSPSKYDSEGRERPMGSFGKKFKFEDGVSCEACHGAGGKYWKKKTMKKIAKEGGVLKSATAKATGMLHPDENLCKTCHVRQIVIGSVTYKNPTYKDFDFVERAKEIAHPRPAKK